MRGTLLSCITTARNDDFHGNFNWRIETVLTLLVRQFEASGRLADAEIIVVDWGSDIPLHTVLSLPGVVSRSVRFIRVPPVVAQEEGLGGDFPGSLIANAGARRALGRYIAVLNADTVMPGASLTRIFRWLTGEEPLVVSQVDRTHIVFPQRYIPWEFVRRSPTIPDLLSYLAREGDQLPVKELKYFTPAGFSITHRDLWYASRGYDESMVHWGFSDIDFALRMSREHSCLNAGDLGMVSFKLEHYPPGVTHKRAKRNPYVWDNPFTVNDEMWGLAAYDLQEFRA